MSEKNLSINWDSYEEQLAEGERNVKFGLGIGAFGAGSLAIIGATCPLCFFVAPAMVGVGLWKRHKAKEVLDGRDDAPRERSAEALLGEVDGDVDRTCE